MDDLIRVFNAWQDATARIPGGHQMVSVRVNIEAWDGSDVLRTNLSNKQEARLVALLRADLEQL